MDESIDVFGLGNRGSLDLDQQLGVGQGWAPSRVLAGRHSDPAKRLPRSSAAATKASTSVVK
jgi:hypothetical protein